jgi:choline kinase
MKAVILAAGIASRLRPLTDHTPKCLLKVGDKNILELTMDNIIANDLDDIILVTGYHEDQIKNFISSKYPGLNVHYIYNELYQSTNNIYSLWLTKERITGDELLLMDSDIVFDKRIITKLIASGYENCLALKRHDVQDEEIKVKTDLHGKVIEIGKEIKPTEAAGESIGIEKFGVTAGNKLYNILDRKILVEKNVNLFYEAAFQELINDEEDIFPVDITEHVCMEIDTAADLTAAGKLLWNQYESL